MAITVKHKFVSAIPDGADATVVRPSNWNDDHDLTGIGTIASQDANAVSITGGTVSGSTLTSDTVSNNLQFTPTSAPSYSEGDVWYDSTQHTLAYYNDATNNLVHVGQEVQVKVINNTGSTIAIGSPVYVTSTSSGQIYPNVALAKADVQATSVVLGLTTQAITNGSIGYVTTVGIIQPCNTGTFTVGDVLYLSPYSAGQLMNTVPPTGYAVRVGIVAYSNSPNGSIYVRQSNSYVTSGQIVGTITVPQGGTGLTSLTAGYIPYGNGTSAFGSSANMTFNGTTFTLANDASINGLTVGLGGGNNSSNVAFGAGALNGNTGTSVIGIGNSTLGSGGNSGNWNTAIGAYAMQFNSTGYSNVALGRFSLQLNTTGYYNVVIAGGQLGGLSFNVSGNSNTAVGDGTLVRNSIGSGSVAIGTQALVYPTTSVASFTITGGSGYVNGTYNNVPLSYVSGTSLGNSSFYPTVNIVVSGGSVTSVTVSSAFLNGGQCFVDTTTVMSCANSYLGGTGSGFSVRPASLYTSQYNTSVGYQAGYNTYSGAGNNYYGFQAGLSNVSGGNNNYFGYQAGYNTTGFSNSFFGNGAGNAVTTGSKNVIIGAYTGSAAPISATGFNYIVLSDGDGNVRQTIDASGNVGVGITPAAWSLTNLKALQIQNGGLYGYSTNEVGLTANAYYNGGYKYISTDVAMQYKATGGTHQWLTAPSGTTGTAITYNVGFAFNSNGSLGFGATPNYGTAGQAVISAGSGSPTTWGDVVTPTGTQTLTNKWVQPRVLASTANSATPTLNTDNYDMMVITGQSVAITSFTTNLTGTPVNGQKLWIAITGTGAIAITWGAKFESSTVALPTTTVTTARLDVGFVWNVATSAWRCVAVA
jgi:hypothetical protein